MTETTQVLADRYRLTGHLSRGGMADVFEATDELLGRRVAVKMLHPQFARDEAFVTRFRREAQAAANLSHPNIVGIYDWGEHEGTYFIVMELIEGRTLRDICRSEGALLPRRAAEIAAEAAAALSVAHQAGVYHRDVKPGNIMLTRDGNVKVTDFGIARALDDSEELTRTGAVIGTATYFSPEQAQGLPADERSDVYSLGVVLYELLTGRAPFTGESPVAVAYQHVSEFAPPPSELNADVPATLEAVVEKAMEKSPADRYQSAEEFRTDLLRFLRGEVPLAAALSDAEAETTLMAPPPATVPPDETARHVSRAAVEERTQSSYIVAILGLLAALAFGVFILFRVLSSGSPATAETVTVPNLAGLSAEQAFERLQNLDLKVQQRNQPSATVDAGVVIGTEPPAGEQVERDTFVTVIISSGPEQFPVPNVLDVDEDAARAALEANGFEVGNVLYRNDENVPEGVVMRQDPAPGAGAAPGSAVDLEVSAGPFALTMPDVAGLAEANAVLRLETEGFENIVVEPGFSNEILEGFVIETRPATGNLVPRDATVTIVVSQGPEPFDLPSFIGLSLQEARNLAQTLSLILVVEEERVDVTLESGLDGRIAQQTPAENSQVLPDDEVRVKLGVLRTVSVPDVVGATEEQASAELESRGLTLEIVGTLVVEDESLVGKVAAQDPAANTTVPEGSVVRVRIGEAPPVTTTTTTATTTTTTAAP